ncbi:MAG: hypothetical protein WAM28_00570 [Chlamydiales bacterium]
MSVSKLINRFEGLQSQPSRPNRREPSREEARVNEAAQQALAPREESPLTARERNLLRWQESYQRCSPTAEGLRKRSLITQFVFRNLAGVNTQNRAKLEEANEYLLRGFDRPFRAELLNELAGKYDVTTDKELIKVAHSFPDKNSGTCNGAVVEWLSTQNHREFEGGVPIKGVYLQYIYQKYSPIDVRRATGMMMQMIDGSSQTEGNLLPVLERDFGSSYSQLYTIFKNLRNDSDNFPDDEFFYAVRDTFGNGTQKAIFTHLYNHYSARKLSIPEAGVLEFTFALNHLEIKEEIKQNSDALELIKSIPDLKPGLYYLSTPVFDSSGEKVGLHALGIKVNENGSVLFYDPNYRIVRSDKNTIKQTIARLLLVYSSLSTSRLENSTQEERMEALGKMGREFDLYRLERNENMHDLRWFE